MVNFIKFVLNTCLFVGVFFISKGQEKDANLADSLILVLKNQDLTTEERYDLLVNISYSLNNTNTQREYANESLLLAIESGNKNWEAKSNYLLGQSYTFEGDLDEGLSHFIKSLKIYDQLNYTHGKAAVRNQLGSIYQRLGNPEEALINYRMSYELYSSIENAIGMGSTLANIGEEYRLGENYDSALYYFNRSMEIFKGIDYKYGLAYSYGNIGLSLSAIGEIDSGVFYINKAIPLHKNLGDFYPISVYKIYLADIYKSRGEWGSALKSAQRSLEIAIEFGLKEQIRDANLKLSELYRDLGDYEKAYKYHSQYIIYGDSINNSEVIRKMTDIRTEYEVSKKQIEIDLLEATSDNQRMINYSLAIGILLMIVLGHLIYQNSQKRKEVNHILSEQKEEIEAQRDQLKDLVKMKDRFFGIISHDLRSPVNSLQGITQLLNYYLKTNQQDQIDEFVGLADRSINNLSSLLDNLLGWALSQQGSLPYYPEQFRFHYVAEEVKKIFYNAALSKNIELRAEVQKDIEIYADRDSVFALVRNLVNNALKFTRENGSIEIKASSRNQLTQICVEDTGIGMPDGKLKTLFVFDRNKSTKGTAGEKGSGLGLALCHDIVRLNGGKISVESEPGKGTKFIITLPAEKAYLKS